MRKQLRLLAADKAGSSATEMALSLPFLMVLLFGALELGYYFMSEHVVQKGVRDAARYASRLPISEYPSCVQTKGAGSAEERIQRVARTGQPDGTTSRLIGWTVDSMTIVTVVCPNSAPYHSEGIYGDFPDGAPIVTVSASVPHPSLFGTIGFPAPTLWLNAQSQSAVFGA